MRNDNPEILSFVFNDDEVFPNNELPLIVIKQAIIKDKKKLATELLELFEFNDWKNCWINGIYDYHHYHSNTHEVLGITEGKAKVLFGGPKGEEIKLQAGDVVVVPAGVAHKLITASKDFKCAGGYPEGADYDMNYGKEGERPAADERILGLEIPQTDPLFGYYGPLFDLWKQPEQV